MNYLLVCQGPPGVSQELPLRAFFGYQHLQYHDIANFSYDNATFGSILGSGFAFRGCPFEHYMGYSLVFRERPGVSRELL